MNRGRVKPDSGLILREKPNGELLSVLRHNEIVDIIDTVTFYRVKTATGGLGYVHGDYLEKMPSVAGTDLPMPEAGDFPSDVYEQIAYENERFIGETAKIDRDFVAPMNRVAEYAKKCDVKIWVTSSTRNLGDQVRGAIVPPASRSCHHVGHAIDMNVMFDGKLYNSQKLRKNNLLNLPAAIGKFINMIREDDILRWGGDFNVEDPVHIDDDFFHRQEIMYLAKLHSRVNQLNT